jgi:anionic cell wall polymer biosynthesis LytR-Cps2A-Psr (LCP) family protein
MSRKMIGLVVTTIALILVLSGGLTYAVLTFVTRPLGKPLNVSVSSTPRPTKVPVSDATKVPTKTSVSGVSKPTQTATAEPALTYLVLGIDVDHQAEAIYVMTTDPVSNSITIVAYSPSLLVNVKGLEALGISKTEFKMVYFNALNLPGGDAATATNLMAQALADNFDIVPDHYLSMNENDIAAQMDAIGGIDVNIPAKFGDFQAGEQHLDGTATWHYVAAIDHPGLELEVPRIERHRQVLQAILRKFFSPGIVPRIPNMVRAAVEGKFVKTDLSVRQILTLANLIQHVPEDHMHFTVWIP